MRAWTFYRLDTGKLVATFASTSDADLPRNTPPGCSAVEGEWNLETHRVDLATGQPLAWRPPRPSIGHDWNDADGRWQLSPRAQRLAAMQRIAELEARQPRAIREAILDPFDNGARERLQAIDTEIMNLRADLAPKE